MSIEITLDALQSMPYKQPVHKWPGELGLETHLSGAFLDADSIGFDSIDIELNMFVITDWLRMISRFLALYVVFYDYLTLADTKSFA